MQKSKKKVAFLQDFTIAQEIAGLRGKYELAVKKKLKMRGFMAKCVKTWMNIRLSRFFR